MIKKRMSLSFRCLALLILASGSMSAMLTSSSKVVIVGGGIHGISLAYYLTERGLKPTVVEKTSIAAAASGKAGGFLAREWGSGPTVALHQKSYDLHQDLATKLHIDSYRRVDTLNVNGNRKGQNVASWLDGKVSSTLMDRSTAQVTPLELTTKMWESAASKGANLIIDAAEDVVMENNKITGVKLKNSGVIDADNVVICLGPWSGVMVEDWFGLSMPMEGVKSTSLVYQDLEALRQEPYAGFCAEDANGCHLELYPRTNGEVYICGCGGSDYVSGDRLRTGGDCASAEDIKHDPKRVAAAAASFKSMTSLGNKSPDIVQACMRPCTADGLPVMGEIPGVKGAFISCAHNCWGILWGPVSGMSMCELLIDGKSSIVDLSAFTPSRYMKPIKEADMVRGRKKGSAPVGEQW